MSQNESSVDSESAPHRKGQPIRSLRKKGPKGKGYLRFDHIEEKISELLLLAETELVERCAIRERDDPLYVPSECVLYFIRSRWADNSSPYFRELYGILSWRVLSRYPDDGGTNSKIREEVFAQFTKLLAKDHLEYCERLDFYEIRFDKSLVSLLRDAQRKVIPKEQPLARLELDLESGELPSTVEGSVKSFDSFNFSDFDAEYDRSQLEHAIDSLPELQRRIIEMNRKGISIHSIDNEVITISRILAKSERTIRLHRDKAMESLKRVLTKEETS